MLSKDQFCFEEILLRCTGICIGRSSNSGDDVVVLNSHNKLLGLKNILVTDEGTALLAKSRVLQTRYC